MRSSYLVLICLFLMFIIFAIARAQTEAPTSPAEKAVRPLTESDTDGDEKREFKTYTLSPEKYEKAVSYSRAGYRLHFINIAYSLLLLLIILALRVGPRFRNRAEAISRRRFVQALIFVPLLLLLMDALRLPLDVYSQRLALKYDISVQGWGSWLWDWTKGELLSLPVASVIIYAFYGVVRRSPRRWWLYSGLATAPLIGFFLFITPVLIDPLFNRFEPLENNHPALVAKIEQVVNRGGLDIPPERMFEMKASEKMKAVSAYVTGFGASKRIVVWDTTIASMTMPQTLFVLGHEMGHYVLGHVLKSIIFVSGLIILVMLLVYGSTQRTLKRWERRLALRGVDDWASLPVLMLFFYLFTFLAEPAFNGFSRYQEHQADIYGLEVTHGVVPDSARAAAGAFQVLGEIDLADPVPGAFIKFWLYSHPPLAERLSFAREYNPWDSNQPARFVP